MTPDAEPVDHFDVAAEVAVVAPTPHHLIPLGEQAEVAGLGFARLNTHRELTAAASLGVTLELPHHSGLTLYPAGVTAEWDPEGFTPLYTASALYHGEKFSAGARAELGFEEGAALELLAVPVGFNNRVFAEPYAHFEEGHMEPGLKAGYAFHFDGFSVLPTADVNPSGAAFGAMLNLGEAVHFE